MGTPPFLPTNQSVTDPMTGTVIGNTGPQATQQVPLPGQQIPNPNDKFAQIMKMLLLNAQRKQAGGTPVPGQVGQGPQRDPMSIGMNTGNPHAWSGVRFTAALGDLIGSAVAKKKQNDILKAEGDWTYMQSALNELYGAQASGDQKGAAAAQAKLDVVLGDPKKLKNMAKALNQDWLNPEKTTVYGEALKKVNAETQAKDAKQMQAAQGIKGIFQRLIQRQQQPQLSPDQQQRMAREIEAKAPTTTPGSMDPKILMELVNQARLEQQHDENLAERKQEHEEALAQRKEEHEDNLALRRDLLSEKATEAQNRLSDARLNREEREQYHRSLVQLHRDSLELRRQQAASSNDPAAWAELVQRGQSLSTIPAKERNAVVEYMNKQKMSVPKPLSSTEQKAIDDATETVSKVDGWINQLQQFAGNDGKLPNKPFTMLGSTLKYYAGSDSPDAALISDLSRERWQAIAPLLHGIRRGDIVNDIVKHTPSPWKDSVSLMDTKLRQLKANFEEARQAILQSHGFEVDPSTGDPIGKSGKSGGAPAPPAGFVVDKP